MNREEAANILDLKTKPEALADFVGPELAGIVHQAMVMGAEALRSTQPDPSTGLMPCGCGGKARLLRKPIGNWVDHKIACDSCTTETAWVAGKDSAEMAKIEWNTAMGWKGDAE